MKARQLIEAEIDPKALVMALPPPREERWIFTHDELSAPQQCTSHDIFIAYVQSEDLDPDGIGVQVERNGHVTNTWGDGTRGVPQELRTMADYEETLQTYDPDGGFADVWRDVLCDTHGQFIKFTAS